jgi:hypothetical protein
MNFVSRTLDEKEYGPRGDLAGVNETVCCPLMSRSPVSSSGDPRTPAGDEAAATDFLVFPSTGCCVGLPSQPPRSSASNDGMKWIRIPTLREPSNFRTQRSGAQSKEQ